MDRCYALGLGVFVVRLEMTERTRVAFPPRLQVKSP